MQWTTSELRERAGHRIVSVRTRPRDQPLSSFGTVRLPFSQVLDKIFDPASEELYYLEGSTVHHGRFSLRRLPLALPELASDLPAPSFIDPSWFEECNVWMSSEGGLANLHYDPADGFLMIISGVKHCALLDPDQTENLYPASAWASLRARDAPLFSRLNPTRPERFPRLRDARYQYCRLEPGDMLYIPTGVWHNIRSQGQNIAANFWWYPPHWVRHWMTPPVWRYAVGYAARAPIALAGQAVRSIRQITSRRAAPT